MINSQHWVHTWTAMPMQAEADKLPPKEFIQGELAFANTTIRQTIKLSLGTEKYIRLRFSNAFSTQNLQIKAATVALAKDQICGSHRVEPKTIQNIIFNGGEEATDIPGGALAVSDPITFGYPLNANTVLTISLYLERGHNQAGITCHPGSRTTSFVALGNRVAEGDLEGASLHEIEHWYFISGVEILSERETATIAIIGDSITDGRDSTTNQNDRWPDRFFTRLQSNPATSSFTCISQAAGGNRILADGLGPNVLSRLNRDILSLHGIQYVFLFEGVNDIGTAESTEESQAEIGDALIAGYKQIATRVHANGIKIFAATITPFGRRKGEVIDDHEAAGVTSYSHPLREQTRQKVNDWIKTCGLFDEVVDFAAVLENPEDPSVLATEFDSGDRLHPNVKAFQALADSIPLDVFTL